MVHGDAPGRLGGLHLVPAPQTRPHRTADAGASHANGHRHRVPGSGLPPPTERYADVLERVRHSSKKWATPDAFSTGYSCIGQQEFRAVAQVLREWREKEAERADKPKRKRTPSSLDGEETDPPSDYSSDSSIATVRARSAAKRVRPNVPRSPPRETASTFAGASQ
ncbi:hypothetical protein BN946_scf185016.g110 [Trametes cinnabarina]|uniref:Uncharacterized protein n=1 Tax=Pycnoporus cinnabarinus TaxID=5643 RepID=A0A060SNE6_PYCCI|nr:hypothetical protein BN946_scf185016.g110 [Trametes cinnabarina]